MLTLLELKPWKLPLPLLLLMLSAVTDARLGAEPPEETADRVWLLVTLTSQQQQQQQWTVMGSYGQFRVAHR